MIQSSLPSGDLKKLALPFLAGKSLTTMGTNYTEGEKAADLRAFYLRGLRVLCGENWFPVKNGRAVFI